MMYCSSFVLVHENQVHFLQRFIACLGAAKVDEEYG